MRVLMQFTSLPLKIAEIDRWFHAIDRFRVDVDAPKSLLMALRCGLQVWSRYYVFSFLLHLAIH